MGEEGCISYGQSSLPFIPDIIQKAGIDFCQLKFAPRHSGRAYKLFVFIRDGKGRLASQVMNFYVELKNNK